MKTLKDVQVGETVTVAKLHGEGPVKRRIMGNLLSAELSVFPSICLCAGAQTNFYRLVQRAIPCKILAALVIQ